MSKSIITFFMVGLIGLFGTVSAQTKQETLDFIISIDDGNGYVTAIMKYSELRLYRKNGTFDSVQDVRKATFKYEYSGLLYTVYDSIYSGPIWAAAKGSPTWMFDGSSQAKSLINALNHLKTFAVSSPF